MSINVAIAAGGPVTATTNSKQAVRQPGQAASTDYRIDGRTTVTRNRNREPPRASRIPLARMTATSATTRNVSAPTGTQSPPWKMGWMGWEVGLVQW
jgi:hypothetical protein